MMARRRFISAMLTQPVVTVAAPCEIGSKVASSAIASDILACVMFIRFFLRIFSREGAGQRGAQPASDGSGHLAGGIQSPGLRRRRLLAIPFAFNAPAA